MVKKKKKFEDYYDYLWDVFKDKTDEDMYNIAIWFYNKGIEIFEVYRNNEETLKTLLGINEQASMTKILGEFISKFELRDPATGLGLTSEDFSFNYIIIGPESEKYKFVSDLTFHIICDIDVSISRIKKFLPEFNKEFGVNLIDEERYLEND